MLLAHNIITNRTIRSVVLGVLLLASSVSMSAFGAVSQPDSVAVERTAVRRGAQTQAKTTDSTRAKTDTAHPAANSADAKADTVRSKADAKAILRAERAKRKAANKPAVPVARIDGLAVGDRIAIQSGTRKTLPVFDSLLYAKLIQDSITLTSPPQDSMPVADSGSVIDTLPRPHFIDSAALSMVHLQLDSLRRIEQRHRIDTAFLGSSAAATAGLAKDKVDTITEAEINEFRRFKVTRDTISAGRQTVFSLIAPGFGQIYNRQPWKLPILYAGLGGFIAGGVVYNNQYQTYKSDWQRTVDLRLPAETQQQAKARMMKAGSGRTLMFAMAGVTYLYFVADAVFKYRGPVDPIRKATTLAAIFPGMGFVYTKTYWRLPIYYGGFIALATVIDYNNRSYMRYKTAYDALTDNNPSTVDEFNGRYSPDLIARVRSAYRRDRDLAIIGMAAAYLLSIVDTYVIASLKNWDVSEDLAVRVEPTTIDTRFNAKGVSSAPPGYGLALKIRF